MIAVRGSDLFNEHRIARLTRLCARLAGPDHADDLAQETLVEALRHANRLHDPSGADAWLAAIARNVALRWRRAAARQERVRRAVASDPNHSEGGKPELDLEQAELADVLQRALSALPDRTRDAVVRSVVMGSSHADIARRHDASPASVAMRISRGKTLLRRSLSVSAADRLAEFGLADAADRVSWRPTQLWCPVCGAARLDIQWLSSPAVIRLRCTRCSGDRVTPAAEYRLDNPSLGLLLGGAVRPTTIVRRAARWVHGYFGMGSGTVTCTGCDAPVRLQQYHRPELPAGHASGVVAQCGRCGETVSVSAAGLALSLPEAVALRAAAQRIRIGSVAELEASGMPALRIAVEAVGDARRVTAVLARDSLRPLVIDSRS